MLAIALATTEAVQETATGGPVALFGLNAKLFIAQLLNFIVVMLVLWKWAYKPLVKLLEDRSQKIEKGLADAVAAEERLSNAGKEREKVIAEARSAAQKILEETKTQSATMLAHAKLDAKAEAEKIFKAAEQAIAAEREKMSAELRNETVDLVVTLTERLLKEKITQDKDRELVEGMLAQVSWGEKAATKQLSN